MGEGVTRARQEWKGVAAAVVPLLSLVLPPPPNSRHHHRRNTGHKPLPPAAMVAAAAGRSLFCCLRTPVGGESRGGRQGGCRVSRQGQRRRGPVLEEVGMAGQGVSECLIGRRALGCPSVSGEGCLSVSGESKRNDLDKWMGR